MRAVAFLAVFAFHTWEFAGRPEIPVISSVISQNIRPDFFVVLTGFVLSMPYARRPERMDSFQSRTYLRRRLRRIVLPYYVALAYAIVLPQVLVVLMLALGRKASWQDVPDLPDILAHLTFSHMFFVDHWSGINGSLWTMSLEMQLYLLFPLLLLAVNRWGWRALVVAIVVSVAFRVLVAVFVPGPEFPDEFLWAASGLGRLMEFAAGMLAAIIAFRMSERIRRPHVAVLIAIMIASYVVATVPIFQGTVLPVRELALAALFGSLIILALTVPAVGRIFAWRPMAFIGYRAYSLFLIHQPTAWYASEFLKKFAGVDDGITLLLLLWTVGGAAVFAVGQLLFITVERPCIEWAKRATPTRPSGSAPTSVAPAE